MSYVTRREKVLAQMAEQSMLVLYSGRGGEHCNKQFFYLTGLQRENMALLMTRLTGKTAATLYIEKADPLMERWTGKMVTADEAKAATGIEDVRYVDALEREINRLAVTTGVQCCYFDCFRQQPSAMPSENLAKAQAFAAANPGVTVRNLWPLVAPLRMEKDEGEVAKISRAIEVTDTALKNVLKHLHPGMYEYQAQADFEYMVHYQGAEELAFPTIAGSGINGTMLHYETIRDICEDGMLLLMDLGAKWEGYCADITRTYPVNGRYTERQRAVYDIVLKANRRIAKEAKPGMTTRQLNDLCKQVLAEGCIALGLIQDAAEIGKYYMHGVSHHLGIDVHDVTVPDSVLTPGCVISDEPGLYIDEWAIGIRIEDDLLITEDGCVCLSEQVMRDPDEIETFMASSQD